MYVCMYMYMYACMHVCMYVCLYACMHVCMYACMHVCMYACMHICMYVCIYACTWFVCMVCVYVCMYVCMYVCTYPCMYVCYVILYLCIFVSMYIRRYVCTYTSVHICVYSHSFICYSLQTLSIIRERGRERERELLWSQKRHKAFEYNVMRQYKGGNSPRFCLLLSCGGDQGYRVEGSRAQHLALGGVQGLQLGICITGAESVVCHGNAVVSFAVSRVSLAFFFLCRAFLGISVLEEFGVVLCSV